jgi:hypothetical protein
MIVVAPPSKYGWGLFPFMLDGRGSQERLLILDGDGSC